MSTLALIACRTNAEGSVRNLASSRSRLGLTAWSLVLCWAVQVSCITRPATAQYISMGPVAFGGAYDQPFVKITLYDDNGGELGPTQLKKSFLLDTGANGILAVGGAASDLHRKGDFSVDIFEEVGVGGTIFYNVSAPYQAEIEGLNSITLDDVRILSDPLTNFGDGVPFEGLVGMPALVNRVTTLDMRGSVGGLGDIDLSDLDALIDALSSNFSGIGVTFHDDLPPSRGHRVAVPTRPLYFDADQGGVSPTYAPLTVVEAEMRGNCRRNTRDNYIIDTGAQLSFISLDVARSLGLDPDDPFSTLTISGVGGTRTVPTFLIEELRLKTTDGRDLVWYGAEVVGLDIHPDIGGVIGSDLLTAGMIEVDFSAIDFDDLFKIGEGPIEEVHFDFRDLDKPDRSGSGVMYFDLNPDYDKLIMPGDVDQDGKVDEDDLRILAGNWQEQFPIQIDDQIFFGQEVGDFNNDCKVDIGDLAQMAEHWQFGVANPTAPLDVAQFLSVVPEPSGLGCFAALALAAAIARRRRSAR